jgi:hypothetical protein
LTGLPVVRLDPLSIEVSMRILVRGATLSLQVLVLLVVASTCRAQTTVTLQ